MSDDAQRPGGLVSDDAQDRDQCKLRIKGKTV